MKLTLILLITTFLISCTNSDFSLNESADGTIFNIIDDQIFDIRIDNLVCDPFQQGDVQSTHGLKASLYSVEKDMVDRVEGFFKLGEKSEQDIYLSNLNVPTRSFSLGFPTITGDLLRKDNGEAIYEWFGLKVESELKLGLNDPEGWYELGILSDDGSRIFVNNQLVVDNDGFHETRMGCGTKKFYMKKDTKLPIRIEYFQGPRYHISIVPMMRKVTEDTEAEPYCGVKSNSLYFDADNGSAPQPAYHEMIARGWKAMEPSNWGIPGADSGKFNPCAEGEVIIMSALTVNTSNSNQIKVTWETDKDATSQVIFKNKRTGKKVTIAGDRKLSKNHEVTLSISNRVDDFEITAISISRELGKVISDPVIAPL